MTTRFYRERMHKAERERDAYAVVINDAIRLLKRANERKAWREDGWEVPAIDVQEALDTLILGLVSAGTGQTS